MLLITNRSTELFALYGKILLFQLANRKFLMVLSYSLRQLEGADSRKRSVEAGLIETVLKLVDGPEPIQVCV